MRESWWVLDPETGDPIRVVASREVTETITNATGRTRELERQVDVMKEAAARIRPRLRRLEYGADVDAHERDTARREIGEIADHIRQGCPTPAEAPTSEPDNDGLRCEQREADSSSLEVKL